jgi:hypothetical protein
LDSRSGGRADHRRDFERRRRLDQQPAVIEPVPVAGGGDDAAGRYRRGRQQLRPEQVEAVRPEADRARRRPFLVVAPLGLPLQRLCPLGDGPGGGEVPPLAEPDQFPGQLVLQGGAEVQERAGQPPGGVRHGVAGVRDAGEDQVPVAVDGAGDAAGHALGLGVRAKLAGQCGVEHSPVDVDHGPFA